MSSAIVAAIQLNCTEDKQRNFNLASSMIAKAKKFGAKMAFLPEGFDYIAPNPATSIQMAESIDGETISKYRSLAIQHNLHISLGGFHRKLDEMRSSKIANSHIVISSEGELVSVYDKLHLFDLNTLGLKESDYVEKGNSCPPVVNMEGVGKIGLGICYDVRFPEFSSHLRANGAQILTFPSAFTLRTGSAGHWHTLLKARAIENQCYVIGAGQTGQHNSKRTSYGHSLIVDPYGTVVTECGQTSSPADLCIAELDFDFIRDVRDKMPIDEHTRHDVSYDRVTSRPPTTISHENDTAVDKQTFRFGSSGRNFISGRSVILATPHSFASVNRSPVVEGHVLVITRRWIEANRLNTLSDVEYEDLMRVVRWVQKLVETHYHVTSSTVNVQDGEEAGQSVDQVHVHVLPRKSGDFKRPDDVYAKLESHDKDVDEQSFRTPDQMAKEACELRKTRDLLIAKGEMLLK